MKFDCKVCKLNLPILSAWSSRKSNMYLIARGRRKNTINDYEHFWITKTMMTTYPMANNYHDDWLRIWFRIDRRRIFVMCLERRVWVEKKISFEIK